MSGFTKTKVEITCQDAFLGTTYNTYVPNSGSQPRGSTPQQNHSKHQNLPWFILFPKVVLVSLVSSNSLGFISLNFRGDFNLKVASRVGELKEIKSLTTSGQERTYLGVCHKFRGKL